MHRKLDKMELWDIYDSDRNKTGRLHRRGEVLTPGDYHLVVGIVVCNESGQVLITKRAADKLTDPDRWESTVGSVLAGEDSLQGAHRELYEETGLDVDLKESDLVYRTCGNGHSGSAFIDVYLVKMEATPEEIRLQPGETCDARWIDSREWCRGILSGELLFPGREKKEQITDAVMIRMNYKENE